MTGDIWFIIMYKPTYRTVFKYQSAGYSAGKSVFPSLKRLSVSEEGGILFFFFSPSAMASAYPFGQCLASLFSHSKWVAQGSDCQLELRIPGFMITTVHWSVGEKQDSTASVVPNDFEAISAKRRKHHLSSKAFPPTIDQKVMVFLLASRRGRPLSSVGGASVAPSAPAPGPAVCQP